MYDAKMVHIIYKKHSSLCFLTCGWSYKLFNIIDLTVLMLLYEKWTEHGWTMASFLAE